MRFLQIAILLVFLMTSVQVGAQVLKTPTSDAQVVINSDMPHRGLTKNEVETRFGQPTDKQGPVGDPAIYRWNYGSYSVFFENNHVIHSVLH